MTDPRPAPYPADTRCKGWRFELDHERIRQSDTWALAAPDVRPWLLMMWMVAWEQVPCGSLPDDDELIAARMGMPSKLFAKHRALLRRGWWVADDGRLYHDTIANRALEMVQQRDKTAKRVAEYKAKMREQHGGNALPTREQHERNDTGTGTGTGTNTSPNGEEKTARKRATPHPAPDDVAAQVWSDWLQLRKAKKAPVTDTVVDGARAEAAKAGLSLEAFLRVWCARGSQGLQADWLKPSERGTAPRLDDEPEWRRIQRERNEAALGPYAAKRKGADIIDMESTNAPARLVG